MRNKKIWNFPLPISLLLIYIFLSHFLSILRAIFYQRRKIAVVTPGKFILSINITFLFSYPPPLKRYLNHFTTQISCIASGLQQPLYPFMVGEPQAYNSPLILFTEIPLYKHESTTIYSIQDIGSPRMLLIRIHYRTLIPLAWNRTVEFSFVPIFCLLSNFKWKEYRFEFLWIIAPFHAWHWAEKMNWIKSKCHFNLSNADDNDDGSLAEWPDEYPLIQHLCPLSPGRFS